MTATVSQESNDPAALFTRMRSLINGYQVTQMIYVVAKLGIADLIGDGIKSSEWIATETSTDPAAVKRMLRALVSFGVFNEDEPGSFSVTAMGKLLQTSNPGSVRAMALLNGEEFYTSWGELMYSIQTGDPAFRKIYGATTFDYRAVRPEKLLQFNNFMSRMIILTAQSVVESYDFSDMHTVIDVGGGNGTMISAILRANPHLKGAIFDLEFVQADAEQYLHAAGVADRCEFISGSFFDSIPSGGDLYIMSRVIHDWTDEESIAILTNCRKAMSDNAKLILVEIVMPEKMEPGMLMNNPDMQMLVLTSGQERTENEYRYLYAQAGITLTRIVPLKAQASIIEGVPAV